MPAGPAAGDAARDRGRVPRGLGHRASSCAAWCSRSGFGNARVSKRLSQIGRPRARRRGARSRPSVAGVAAHRLAEERRAGEDEAPRQLDRLRDADANAGVNDARRIVAAGDDAKRPAVEAQAVVRVGDAERLAKPPRPRAEQALRRRRRGARASARSRPSARARGSAPRRRARPARRRSSGTSGCRRSGRRRRAPAARTSPRCARCGRRSCATPGRPGRRPRSRRSCRRRRRRTRSRRSARARHRAKRPRSRSSSTKNTKKRGRACRRLANGRRR